MLWRLTSIRLASLLREFNAKPSNMPAAPDKLVPVLVFSIIGWRMVSRVRRNVGRQVVLKRRLLGRIGIYLVITAFLAVALVIAKAPWAVFAGLSGGLALGAGLGLLGLRLTKFEATAEGRFYTPNPYIGVGVSFLLIGRLAYRFIVLSGSSTPPSGQSQTALSPFTLLLYGILAGYYVTYFIGVSARSRVSPPPSGATPDA